MSYDAKEQSQTGGSPVEMYLFTCGSTAWHFASSDDDQLGPGSVLYSPTVISRGEIDASDEDQQGALEVTLLRTNAVAAQFIAGLPVAPVYLTIYRQHRSDTEVVQLWSGQVASAKFDNTTVVLSCMPGGAFLQRTVPGGCYQASCNWALYSTQCGVNKSTYAESGTLASMTGTTLNITISHDRASGYFTNGFILTAAGDRRWILSHTRLSSTVAQVVLMTSISTITTGAALVVYPGCDHTIAACTTKYANQQRFLGFPYLPIRNPYQVGVI